jgi:hypothetical protein
MQVFEYLEVRLSGWRWEDSAGKRGRITPGAGRSPTAQDMMASRLEEMEAEGWELIGVVGDATNSRSFFRRPARSILGSSWLSQLSA